MSKTGAEQQAATTPETTPAADQAPSIATKESRIAEILAKSSDQGAEGEANAEGGETTQAEGDTSSPDAEGQKTAAEGQESDSDTASAETGAEGDKPEKSTADLLAGLPDTIAEKMDKAFTALADREAKLRDLSTENKTQKTELEDLQKLKADLEADPYSTIERLGGTYEEWSERILKGGIPGPSEEIRKLQDEIAELKKAQETKSETETEAKQAKEQAEIVNRHLSEMDKMIETNADRYAAIRKYPKIFQAVNGYEMDLHMVMKQTAIEAYQNHEKILSDAEVVESINAEFAKKLEAMPESAIKALLGESEADRDSDTSQADQNTPTAKGQNSPKTITQGLAASSPAKDVSEIRTREEKIAALAARSAT